MTTSPITLQDIPYEPIKWEYGVPYYDLLMIDLYGPPHHYGIETYHVLDNKESSCPAMMDYKEEQDRRGCLRPIHRYSALKRFEYLVKQLLGGCRSLIPQEVILQVSKEMNHHPEQVWVSVRTCLKKHGYQKYFNRIPEILKCLEYPFKIIWEGSIASLILDFKKIHHVFHSSTFDQRVYFPSFRFFALKILESRGCIFQYDIPLMNTPRKIPVFEDLWLVLQKSLFD